MVCRDTERLEDVYICREHHHIILFRYKCQPAAAAVEKYRINKISFAGDNFKIGEKKNSRRFFGKRSQS